MWSEHFETEARSATELRWPRKLASSALAVLGASAVAAALVFSVQVTSDELTMAAGDWPLALLALAIGALGPYVSILTWRRPAVAALRPVDRVAAASVSALACGALSFGALLLLQAALHRPVVNF